MKNDVLNALYILGRISQNWPFMIFILLSVVNFAMADTSLGEVKLKGTNNDRSEFLQGKRLFFDSHERATHQSAQQALDYEAVNRELKEPRSTIASLDDSAVGQEPLIPSSPQYRLRYEAYIRSADAISIIVNGRLCVPLVHDANILEGAIEQKLDCPSFTNRNLTLLLLDETKSLTVMHGRHLIGTLMPGQSL